MYEQYGMGQYPFSWGGVTPPPNWQPQIPPMQQNQQGIQGIQGVRFVNGIEEAKNCTIPLGSKALLMDKEKDRFYLKETNTTAAVQKVLDAIQQDKIEALQGQVNQLQLQSALCGVVRYPNSTTFTAGYNPYFNANACGCGTTF